MGMFDSIYDPQGIEWQTKALAKTLAQYRIGSPIPGPPTDYQMEILGDERTQFQWSYLTVRSGRVVEVPSVRIESLPLLGFSGDWTGGEN